MKKEFDFPTIEANEDFLFECTNCGDCCRNVKEAVFIDSLDLFRIACYLKKDISEVLLQYTEMKTPFRAYPMLVLKTKQYMDACVFLKSSKCSIHAAKPRTCRTYPLCAGPKHKDEFEYLIVSKDNHHFKGQKYKVIDWMNNCLDSEDKEFIFLEFEFAGKFAEIFSKIDIALEDEVIRQMIFFKYIYYDISEKFLNQYKRNICILENELRKMIR